MSGTVPASHGRWRTYDLPPCEDEGGRVPAAPRVSVVIPTHNSSRYLADTLDSVLAQTMTDLEVVLYDDGSSDDTLDVAASYAARDGRVHVVRGTHGGIAAARNNGFAATDPAAEFVTFFDHDDVWEPGALASLVAALDAHPECPAAHGVARCIDSNGWPIPGDDHADSMRNRVAVVGNRIVEIPRSSPTTMGAVLVKNYITTPGTSVVRRQELAAVGGFEPATVPCDDWDMNIRLTRRGPFAFVDEIVLNWRRHDNAASNVSERWRAAYMMTRRRSVDDPANTPSQRKAALVALRCEVVELQRGAFADAFHGAIRTAPKKFVRSLMLGSIYLSVRRPRHV